MASSPHADDGLLFVYGECGPHVTEDEFNEWYDTEHAPARIALPLFSTAVRYKAVDGKSPSWLAVYDTATPEDLQSPAYTALAANASANEKSIISRLRTLNRRIYRRIATVDSPNLDATTQTSLLPAHAVLVGGFNPGSPEVEREMNKWYEEEHLEMLSRVPGFIRVRRYELVSHVELAGNADPSVPGVSFQYLALYEWENEKYRDEEAFKTAVQTPWSVKMVGAIAGYEDRSFVLYKNFEKGM
ncbi:hypothetical protein H0H92_012970 [Tricholoma furcatifolium]|nr:hypothetical protein H0H92_012970 [Tricholoma furcatifolium]